MQKNGGAAVSWVLSLALAGCAGAGAAEPEALQGTMEFDEVTFAFDVGGKVARVAVREGEVIAAGAPIAVLDDALARMGRDVRQADVATAEAQLALVRAGSRQEDVRATSAQLDAARKQWELLSGVRARQLGLVDSGAAPAASLDELDAQLVRLDGERRALGEKLRAQQNGARTQEIQAAEARLAAARAGLAVEEERLVHHRLAAARGGTVLDVHVEPGEVVGAGGPVVTVGDTEHPYVDVFVPQGHLGDLAEGSAMVVRVDAEPAPFAGKVEHLGRHTEFTPRFLFSERERPNLVVRVRVRLELPAGERLHAGVPAFVTRGAP